MKWSKKKIVLYMLPAGIVFTSLLAARYGAVRIGSEEIFSALQKSVNGKGTLGLNERIFLYLRLPRVLLCIFVGASLSVGGTLLQALFRNPIVEPGLIGTSGGAAFGAALYFVFSATLNFQAGEWTLPIAACVGGMLTTWLVFFLSGSNETGKSAVITLLLAGIAINTLCMSGVGLLSYIARDPQARSITFWGMGTLSGANWSSVAVVGISAFLMTGISLRFAKQLNALMMGEHEAMFLGVDIRRLKLIVLATNVVMISVATAFVGVISFVGLIVPHCLRMLSGSDNRQLIRNSALMGAVFLLAADLLARLAFPPAELPIGIVTSVVGVPVFIFLLRKKKYLF